MTTKRISARVVIDYQNIHLSGHDMFVPKGIPRHESLVHPLHFANQWLQVRQHVMGVQAVNAGEPAAIIELASVVVYRGLPSNKENPKAYRRNLAQQSEWTRDRRVTVTHRTLRYNWVDGEKVPQEKGIDVLVALELVRSADRGEADMVVLATHDTDLEPAVAAALENRDVMVETVGWERCRVLRVPGRRVHHTKLYPQHFIAARDRKDYT